MTSANLSASALDRRVRKSWEQFTNKDKAGFAAGLAEGYNAVEDLWTRLESPA